MSAWLTRLDFPDPETRDRREYAERKAASTLRRLLREMRAISASER